MYKPPFAKISFAPAAVDVVPLKNGGMVLRSPQKLEPYPASVGHLLEHWAAEAPNRVFLAERDGGSGWRKVSYAQTLDASRSIGQALLVRELSAERPVAILAENSIDHALLMLGAMHVGVPVAPVSPAYALMSQDCAKLKHILDLLDPGMLFVSDGVRFARALGMLDLKGVELVVSGNFAPGVASTPFGALLDTRVTPAVEAAFATVTPDTVAKILFTSGSTDLPKGVVNTQRMMCSNQQAITQIWPFLSEKPPVIVDWLPWNHTFGGNHNFNMMLRHGGTLYIDDGKPTPEGIEKTVANLREISPTAYFNVPKGFDMLLPFLESDEPLRNSFFHRLDMIFYAGAALPQNLWERLEDCAVAAREQRVVLLSSWGSTETAPMITGVHFEIERAGVVGLPSPGCEVKMVPNGGKMELRVRGPNVTPGYWKRDDLTRAAFDEEGFYCMGDAGRFADPEDPSRGIEFDGRIAEDFKLMSGTWVHVGSLRLLVIAAGAPVIQDAVITGHNQEEIGLLVFPSLAGCRSLCHDLGVEAPLSVLIQDPRVRDRVAKALATLARDGQGSSQRPTRALLMDEPPSIDGNEITDKGYLNQRAVLLRRDHHVERLYSAQPDPGVIRLANDRCAAV